MDNGFKTILNAALVLALVLAAACGGKTESAETQARGTIQAPLYHAELVSLPVYTTAVGNLEPYNRAQLSTRVMGHVKEVLVREGDRVRQGQNLLRLDMQATRGQIDQAEAMLDAAKSQLTNAEAYYNRIKSLYEDKSATKQALDTATAQYEGAKAQVAAAKGGVAGARSNLDYSIISAPFSGFITRRFVDRGDLAAPGAPLIILEQQDSLKLVSSLSEQEMGKVAAGDTAWVESDTPGAARRPARIEAVVPAADPRTRSFRVKLVLDNRDGALNSGAYSRVYFRTGVSQGLAVPEEAVVRQGELTGVFTVNRDGLTRLRWLSLGRSSDGMVEVLSGLSPGESVVLAGDRLVREGEKVQEVPR